MNQPPTQQIPKNIDLKLTQSTSCVECNNETFQEAIIFRKVSAIVTGTGKDGYLPVQTFACIKCGHVNEAFLPEELRKKSLLIT